MANPWTLERGARVMPDGSVRFSVWAPNVRAPRLRICAGAARGEYPLAPNGHVDGEFTATIANVGAGADYVIVVEDGRALPDPVSRWQPAGVHGPSRIVDPNAFTWTDASWRGVTLDEFAIYELHVGTFTPAGTFDAIVERLPALKALGITAIEIMPVAQFPGDRNWGYDGVGLYAAQHSYGGPDGLKRLVDAAHATGLGVVLDVVYNHLGPEGNYLDAFGPYYTNKYTTPWGRALNYDDAQSDEVRRFVVDNARYWIDEYHVDALRLDAVHGIFDFSARHILREIADAVREQGALAGRSVVVIGESDLNDPKLLRPVEEHGYGLDAQWSDDFHHAVHTALTGESGGYYADFAGSVGIADALREPFVYDGTRHSRHRRRKHGAPSTGIPRRRFVVATQNHDQVGNRAGGDRLSTMLEPRQLRLAAALLILSPYIPLIFMGEEYGETNPFLYFVSHSDPELLDAVRRGRRHEFESFGWDDVPDPAAPETFEQSKIDWARAAEPAHAELLALYRDLLALRRDEPLLRPDGARLTVCQGDSGWVSLLRESPDPPGHSAADAGAILALFNCAPTSAAVPIPESSARAWSLRLCTDAAGYGGTAEVATEVGVQAGEPRRLVGGDGLAVCLPPWTAAVYVPSPVRG